MPIKKRTNLPTGDEPAPVKSGPLVIESKPKQATPPGGLVKTLYGAENNPSGASLRRLGSIAKACGDTPDAKLTIEDRVTLMRTVYDTKNPQEQRYRNRVRNRATAITAMCITCTGTRKGVTECLATDCPLWSFRLGGDPFYGSKGKV